MTVRTAEQFLQTLQAETSTATGSYAVLVQDCIRAVEKTIEGRRQHEMDMARLAIAAAYGEPRGR